MYLKSPFNYTGSKYKLLDQLFKYFPKDINVFWDLFCGGGAVFINIEAKKICANDVIRPLMQFYDFLRNHDWNRVLKIIMNHNVDASKDQDKYNELRNQFNFNKNYIDFFILICSCTNNMMRFNKKFEFNQTWGKRRLNNKTIEKLKLYHDKLYNSNNIRLFNRNFYECNIKQHDFVYLDPPYLITEAGYNTFWSKELEKQLYDYIDELDKSNIKFALSNILTHKGKDNPHYDRIKKYDIVELNYNYNKVSRNGKSQTKEILVKNY